MKVEGEHLFKATPQQVWDLFRDPAVMSAALPGTNEMAYLGDNKYQASMNVRVGPVAGEFTGELLISNEDFPRSYTLIVEGRGQPGFMKGTGDITLVDLGQEGTSLKYTGEVQIGGKLAAVGQRLIDTVSKSLISQAFETLDQVLAEQISANAEGREASYQGASQADYAGAVAKHLLGGMLSPSSLRWIAAVVMVLIAAAALVLLLR
jgi:carbon monoxide dehydrogenase subunit G